MGCLGSMYSAPMHLAYQCSFKWPCRPVCWTYIGSTDFSEIFLLAFNISKASGIIKQSPHQYTKL